MSEKEFERVCRMARVTVETVESGLMEKRLSEAKSKVLEKFQNPVTQRLQLLKLEILEEENWIAYEKAKKFLAEREQLQPIAVRA